MTTFHSECKDITLPICTTGLVFRHPAASSSIEISEIDLGLL